MESIDLKTLKKLDNPKGLRVVNEVKSPTLYKIIDSSGVKADSRIFSSRQNAEFALYKLLTQPVVKKDKK